MAPCAVPESSGPAGPVGPERFQSDTDLVPHCLGLRPSELLLGRETIIAHTSLRETRQLTRELLGGHSGTTMARIQEYAGVSRGSLTHHFGSMQELLVAAISHVAEGQLAETTEFAAVLAPEHDPDDLVGLLHRFMSGPMFVAGLELWLAARTDDALRRALVPVERNFGYRMRNALQDKGIVGPGAKISRADLETLFVLLRGLAVTQILRDDDTTQRRILSDWAERLRETPISTQ